MEHELKAEVPLEKALDTISGRISPQAEARFRKEIGDFVAEVDCYWRDQILLGKQTWVGSRLLKAMVERLPPLNPRLSVVTSNYDMLIEYACSVLGVRWTTGFARGLVRGWDWEAAQDRLLGSQIGQAGQRSKQFYVPLRRVELLKVHGSINRFQQDGRQVECDLWVENAPPGVERDVAVPGTLKHKHSSNDTTDMKSHVTRAEKDSQAFLFAGYGFGDDHLYNPILGRVRQDRTPLVVLTKYLPDSKIAELRGNAEPVWLLLAGSNDESETRAFIPGRSEPVLLDLPLWKCDVFAEEILRG